jgi:hexosaminidase
MLLLLLAGSLRAQDSSATRLNIVPAPAVIKSLPGSFTLDDRTRILVSDEELRRIAVLFNGFLLANHGLHLPIEVTRNAARGGKNQIVFTQAGAEQLPAEGYRLRVTPNAVVIIGHASGLFYGMQTLLQMMPLGEQPSATLPALEITDFPRFAYRGVLLDTARHFFPVPSIEKLLDILAQYKINRFHWHLTDDEAWRIEIKKYPELTRSFPGQANLDAYARSYYTQQQIKDVVAYAKTRFITIVPEIEMPGHSQAALAAYPNLGCPAAPAAGGAPSGDVLCPKEGTFHFLEDVLTEVVNLFPGPYVHIGGDEVSKDSWKQSPEAQAIMKREGLKDENQLETYFVQRAEQFLRSKGKRTIGWDEILEGGLAPNAVVMSWRGESGGIAAAKQKHQVVMSPTDYCYFDYYQGDARHEPPAIGGFLPLQKVYRYDPVPTVLALDERQYILGVQANLWSEYITNPEHMQYMLFPRLFALSEIAWSPPADKNYQGLLQRLSYQLGRLEQQDVNYRIPEPQGLNDFYTATEDHVNVQLASIIPASQIRYTLDGSVPTEQSPLYESPFQVPLQADHKTVLNVVVITPRGRRSGLYEATLLRASYRDPVAYSANQAGLAFSLYEGKFTSVQELERGTPVTSGDTGSLGLQQFGRQTDYGVSFQGYLRIPDDGFYEFAVESDDGAILDIDGEQIVNNDGNHGDQLAKGHIPLRRGFHRLQLRYFQAGGGSSLEVTWGVVGRELKPVDGSVLYH